MANKERLDTESTEPDYAGPASGAPPRRPGVVGLTLDIDAPSPRTEERPEPVKLWLDPDAPTPQVEERPEPVELWLKVGDSDEQGQVNPYPNRIEDKDKAHVMALAGKDLESDSANLRALEIGRMASGLSTPESIQATYDAIDANNQQADKIYDLIEDGYDRLQGTKR